MVSEEPMETVPTNNKQEDISPDKDGGILKEIIKEGQGSEKPANGCKVYVHYTGKLTDGTVFDSSRDRDVPFDFTLGKGRVIKGWDIGVATMTQSEVAIFTIRHDFAYGESGSPPKIPPKATLIFEVELIEWEAENLSGKKDSGILRYPIQAGTGFDSPKESAEVKVSIKGEHNGRVFDERDDVVFCLGEGKVVDIPPGLDTALEHFNVNETSKIVLKPRYGFGAQGHKDFGIPPDSTLTYTVTLKQFEKVKDSWMLNNDEKLEESKKFKEKGTNYFKAGRYDLALKMYKKILDLISAGAGFDEESEAQRKPLVLAGHLNVSMCHLKLNNFVEAKNSCDSALELEKDNLKALFRKGQALLSLSEPEKAKECFDRVLALEPDNKAAQTNIAMCQKKLKEIRAKEKKMYANMFEKFAQKDREWRFGWLDGDKPQVEEAPDNPEIEEEKKRRREEKRKNLERTRLLLEEKRKREAEERMKEQEEGQSEEKDYDTMKEKADDSKEDTRKEEEERKKQPDVMKGCFGEWGTDERQREPTDFEKENPDIFMLEGSGDFKNM